MRRSSTFFATAFVGALALLSTLSGANAVTISTSTPFSITCSSTGQECDGAYKQTVTTSSLLRLEFQSDWKSCAAFSVSFLIDGQEVFKSSPLQPFETTGVVDASPIAPGSHLVEVRAQGVLGGCDEGTLYAWAGRLNVDTNDGPVTTGPPPAPGTNDSAPASAAACKDGGWRSFKSPAFKNQGQCVSFAQHQTRTPTPE